MTEKRKKYFANMSAEEKAIRFTLNEEKRLLKICKHQLTTNWFNEFGKARKTYIANCKKAIFRHKTIIKILKCSLRTSKRSKI